MTIAEILANEELRRHEFPVARKRSFWPTPPFAPCRAASPKPCANTPPAAMLGDQEETFPAARIRQARELAARLLCAQPEEIAFVGPTSLALSFVARGLPWRKGDKF